MFYKKINKDSINYKGFTLIEAMVAILILSFAMLGTMTWVSDTYKNSNDIGLRREASKLAQELIETDRMKDNSELCPSGTNPPCNRVELIRRYFKRQNKGFCLVKQVARVVPNSDFTYRVNYNIFWDIYHVNPNGDTNPDCLSLWNNGNPDTNKFKLHTVTTFLTSK